MFHSSVIIIFSHFVVIAAFRHTPSYHLRHSPTTAAHLYRLNVTHCAKVTAFIFHHCFLNVNIMVTLISVLLAYIPGCRFLRRVIFSSQSTRCHDCYRYLHIAYYSYHMTLVSHHFFGRDEGYISLSIVVLRRYLLLLECRL